VKAGGNEGLPMMRNGPTVSLRDLVWQAANGVDDPWIAVLLAPVLAAAEQGDFLEARREVERVRSRALHLPAVQEACELADRLDCFLAGNFSGDGAALARSCRNDLEVLSVLADWLAENGRPQAATEARSLLDLVRGLDFGCDPLGKPPLWWNRGVEAPEEMDME
jgi:hypothetical protein